MKNIKSLILFFAFAALTLTACNQSEPENTVIVNIDGGTPVTMNGQDVIRDITITTLEAVNVPITITLTCNAKEGEAILENNTLTIGKGETTATTKITFSASKFPLGTAEKKISIVASSNSDNIQFKTSTTDFFIRSSIIDSTLPELEISTKNTTINTTDAEGIAEITFSLDGVLSKDLEITATYDKGLTVHKKDITQTHERITIPKNHLSATSSIKVKQGSDGVIPLKFTPSDPRFSIESLKLTFVVDPMPSLPMELCGIKTSSRNFAFTKTYTVGNHSLTPEHNVDGSYGYEDKTKTVIAKIAEGGLISIQLQNAISSQFDTYALVAWVDWNRSGKLTDNEQVCYKTINAPARGETAPPYTTELKAPAGTPDGRYIMRLGIYYNDNTKLNGGCGTIDNGDIMDITIDYTAKDNSEASISPNGSTKIYVDDQNIVQPFTVARSVATASPATVHLSVGSTGTDSPTVSSSTVTIPAYQSTAEGTITFRPTSSQQATVTVKIVSALGATISENSNKIIYDVTYQSQSEVPPAKLCPFSVLYNNSIFTESFSAGDYTLSPKHNTTDKTYGYTDLTTTQTANVKEGDLISVTYGNQDSRSGTYISAAWVDWNKDGTVDHSEMILSKEWNTSSDRINKVIGTVKGTLKAPAGTRAGTYIMRIGSSSKRNLTGGCGKVEEADLFDIRISFLY